MFPHIVFEWSRRQALVIAAQSLRVAGRSDLYRGSKRRIGPLGKRPNSQGIPLDLCTYLAISGGLPRSGTVDSQGIDKVGSLAKRFILMVSLAPQPGASRTGKVVPFTWVVVVPSLTVSIWCSP